MGCDIHFYVEKKVNGEWVSADTWFEEAGPLYDGRNYDLFGMLANVRNGSGFAGCDTGEGFKPIHELRGVPEDASPNVKASAECWDWDGHSHSWATVKELMEYDWTQTTKKRGWVSPKEFARFHLDGRPQSWSGGVGGGGIQHISNEEMLQLIMAKADGDTFTWRDFHNIEEGQMMAKHYTQVEWQVKYYESASSFLSETMPQLWRMGNPEDVRCVFWFDS